ncbi:MAG: glycosyltransferase [Frankiaceae bacterium]
MSAAPFRRGRRVAGTPPPLAALAVVSAAVWGGLTTLRGRYWRIDRRLPEPAAGRTDWPSVAVVIPARDETAMLPETLPAMLAQDYPGPFRVVLVDDRSSDGTAALARGLGRRHGGDRLAVLTAADRPPGWAGKVWALRQGLDAVRAEPPRYVLLTDADIAHPPDSVRRLVTAAEDGDLDLVSLMALLRCETPWERLLVPAFVYFFAQLYPARWASDPRRRTAAAAGGCMLVRSDALAATGWLEPMRDALIDDVTLAGLVKRRGGAPSAPPYGRSWLGHTTEVVSRRPYPRLADVWDMVARSAYAQLRHSPLLLAGTVAGLVVTYAVPPVAALAGSVRCVRRPGAAAATTAACGAAACAAMTATYLPVVRHYRLPARWATTLPVAAMLYFAMTVDSGLRHRRGTGGRWKGRTY